MLLGISGVALNLYKIPEISTSAPLGYWHFVRCGGVERELVFRRIDQLKPAATSAKAI